MTLGATDLQDLAVATLGGAAVGLERQWSGHALAHFAGLRTFALLGATGGLAGLLWQAGLSGPAVVLVAAAGGLVVAGYVSASRTDVDATTEVAALVVLAASLLAGLGATRVASGIFALTSLLLVEKSRLHALVARLDDVGLRAGVRFGVMAVVVLPLLPPGPLGPLALEPRRVWLLVLFFSGVSFAGYVARRAVGVDRGYWAAGLFGGLVSSTQVTWTFARLSRAEPDSALALATGAIAANVMLFPRVLLTVSLLQPALALPVAARLAAPAAIGIGLLAWLMRRPDRRTVTSEMGVRNPLELGAALQMAALFQVVLLVVDAVSARWGDAGVLTSAAVLGATDVDALTLAMTHAADTSGLRQAATAITVGILANTLVKAGAAALFGVPAFRRVAGTALLTFAVALAAAAVHGYWPNG